MNKNLYIVVIAFSLGIFVCQQTSGQNASFDVYPSDEELFDAYVRGDIDYTTYQNLLDLLESGIDSSNLYLLEEIPNLNYFTDNRLKDYQGLEKEQSEAFISGGSSFRGKPTGTFVIKRYQDLDETASGSNRYIIRSAVAPGWSFQGRMNEDTGQNREWLERSLVYRGDQGLIKKMAIGNFPARYGLGLSVGYRGRVLNKNFVKWHDFFLYPDNGGFNGVYIEAGRSRDAVKLMVHNDRNDSVRVQTVAASLMRRFRALKLEGIFTASEISNSQLQSKYSWYQVGSFVKYQKDPLVFGMELAFPQKSNELIGAVLMESEYRTKAVTLLMSFWKYSNDYLNLTGGGRSGPYSRAAFIDTVDFHYHDRRSDQAGILFKGVSALIDKISYHFSFSTSGRDRYLRYLSAQSGVDWAVSNGSVVRIEYRYRDQNDSTGQEYDHQVRTELKTEVRGISARTYLGYDFDRQGNKYLSYFVRARRSFRGLGETELWLNAAKINMKSGKLDYLYSYLREGIAIIKNFEMAVKYSYRYSRALAVRNSSHLYLEAKLIW